MRFSDWSSDVCSSDLVSPQRLTGMLFEGALTRLATARGAMARGETAAKLRAISGTVAIIEHLRGCLDMQAGGGIARNLDAIYDYVLRRLVHANVINDTAVLVEVEELLRTIAESWAPTGYGRCPWYRRRRTIPTRFRRAGRPHQARSLSPSP